MANDYQSGILKLNPREHVRKRPGMYFGGADSHAMHNMAFYVLENSIDKAINGNVSHILVTLHNAHTITIEDFCDDNLPYINEGAGKGISTWFEKKTSPQHTRYISNMQLGFVDAASTNMDIEVRHHGEVWEYHSLAGIPINDPKITRPLADGEPTGTKITFSPDYEVFEKNDIQATIIRQRLQELSFLLPQVIFTFVDEQGAKTIFHHPNGLTDYLAFINRDKKPLHPPITIHIHEEVTERHWSFSYIKDIDIKIAFQYVDDYIFYPLNYINTYERLFEGVHTKAFIQSMKYGIQDKMQVHQSIQDNHFTISEITYGLAVVVSIFHPHPMTENTMQWILINPELEDLVDEALSKKFKEISETDQQLMDILHQKCLANYHYHRARKTGE